MGSTYIWDQAWEKERERLGAVEAVWDPGTVRVLESIPVRPGWRCLEVGAGAGSIARWLCEKVDTAGSVVATDIDTRFLDSIEADNLEVLEHDVTSDDFSEGEFDLVHTRLLLEHLPDRDEALKRMIAALKPGGWIVVEDFDWGAALDTPSSRAFLIPVSAAKLFQKVVRGTLSLMEQTGYDPEYGRWVPAELRAHGLVGVRGEGRNYVLRGGTADLEFYRLSLAAAHERIVAAGLLTEEEISKALSLVEDPSFATMSPLMIAAWGHRQSL